MGCYIHVENAAVDTCSECGQTICHECSVLINGRVTCKDCLIQKVDLMTGLPKFKTLKDPSDMPEFAYRDLFRHPDILSGMIVTAGLMVATLYICLDSSLNMFTPIAALVTIFAMVLIVYDVNKVMNKA